MPVSIFNDTISAAIRDTLTTTSNGSNNNSIHKTDEQLISSTKLMLLSNKIEYIETANYKTTQDILKSKYVYLKAQPNNSLQNNNNSCVNATSTNSNGTKLTLIEKENKPNLISENGLNKTLQLSKEARLPVPKRILFPRENVQIGWKNSVRKWKIGAGMVNVGNTCYLNSALQAIFHVPAFANWLISDSLHRDKCLNQDTCIVCQMAETLLESQKNDVNIIKPWKIYSKLRLICRHFVPGRQEDAHEFLRYLIDAMEKSYLARIKNSKDLDQHSKETTPLNQILGGYLRSAVRCLACGHVSTTFQHFEEIILDIRKSNTIEEALNLYFARERLEDMGYTCESCKKKVSATKQFSLERAPVVLCIQLKRFIIGSKLNKHINIRTKLDLTPYSSLKTKISNGSSGSSTQLNYKLVSMVTHLGPSQHSGHYTAIGLTDSNGYYQFDDSCVRQISVQNVLNTNAYVMFYELDNTYTNCTTTSGCTIGEKENGYHNNTNNHVSSTVTATTTNSYNINRNNENKIGFIGPMLPPKNNQIHSLPISVTSTITTHTSATGSGGIKPLTNGIHTGTKLVLNNRSSDTRSPVANITNGLKRANSVDSSIEVTKTTPEKKPNLVLLNNIKTLPSMPKLIDESTSITGTTCNTATLLLSVPLNINTNNKKQNGSISSSKPISLVPYDSNDDSDNNDSDDNRATTITTTSVIGNGSSSLLNKNTCLTLLDTDDDENVDYDEDDSNKDCRNNNTTNLPNGVITVKKHNITATTIIQTKAGIWEVSEIEETEEIQPKPPSNNNNKYNNHNNNIVKNSNFKNNNQKYFVNNKKTVTNSNENGQNTVNQLLKMSYRGYGANIQSWNGGKSTIEKEVLEDKREERKRIKEDEIENEMDRGRVKKIKFHELTGADNPGFNQFQEIQNQQLQHNSKWNNDKFHGRIFRQNKHYHHRHHNNNQHHRHHNNNNYRNRNFNSNHRGHHQKRDNHHR